jgi:hypothetical protein
MNRRSFLGSWALASLVGSLALTVASSCGSDLDTNRVVPDRGSFGAIVTDLMVKRVERFEPDRAQVLLGHGPELTEAIDQAAPKSTLTDLDNFLQAGLPLVDDGTFAGATNPAAVAMATLANDANFLQALWHFEGRDGYRAPSAAQGLVRALVTFSGQTAFMQTLATVLAKGSMGEDALYRVGDAVTASLASPEAVPDPADPGRTLNLVRSVLGTQDPSFESTAAPQAMPAVQRDVRGLPMVAARGTQLPMGLVDSDGDGLPDVDAHGRFIDANGVEVMVPTPFPLGASGIDVNPRDDQGRALAPDGQPLYVYRDLNSTELAGVARELPALFDPDPTRDIALVLARGLNTMLGPRTSDGSAFDASRAPMLDMLHGFVGVLGGGGAAPTLEAARVLVARESAPSYGNPLARLVRAIIATSNNAGQDANALMKPGHTLYEEILRPDPNDPEAGVAARAAALPGFIEDLVAALEDMNTESVGPQMAMFLQYKDFIYSDLAQDIVTPVDRGQPDQGDNQPASDNRSLFQRMLHLIRDGNRVELCNQANAQLGLPNVFTITVPDKCQILRVPNIAVAYLASIAGLGELPVNRDAVRALLPLGQIISDGVIDQAVQLLTGIDPNNPSPEQLSRLVFEPLNDTYKGLLGDEIIDRDGVPYRLHHPGTAYAWEKPIAGRTFYEAMKPIALAFCKYTEAEPRGDNDPKCNPKRAELFGDLLSLFHRHWASPQSATYQDSDPSLQDYSKKDNAVSYEDVIAFAMTDSGLLRAATVFSIAAGSLTLSDGTTTVRSALAGAAGDLFTPTPGLTARPGSALVFDENTDGRARSRFDFIFDAYSARFNTLAQSDPTDSWRTATSRLIDIVFRTSIVGDPGGPDPLPALDPRWQRVLLAKVDLLRDRLAAHTAAGDLQQWVSVAMVSNLAGPLSGKINASLLDLLLAIDADQDAKGWFYAMTRYLLDESQGAFVPVVTGVADLLDTLQADPEMVAILGGIGRALGTQTGFARGALTLVARLLGTPKGSYMATLMQNLVDGGVPQTELGPLARILDVLSDVQRTMPGLGYDIGPTDYSRVLYQLAQFLVDEERGLPKFYAIVHCRLPGACPPSQ